MITGDANLYLPAVQTASAFHRPQRVMTVICGIAGTVLGLGIYQHFIAAIDLLASIAPPLIGPLLVEFYITSRHKFEAAHEEALPAWNPAAFLAFGIGVGVTFITPEDIAKALVGLLVSMIAYAILAPILKFKANTPEAP